MRDNIIYVDFSKGRNKGREGKDIIFKIKKVLKKIFSFNKKSPTPKNVIVYRKNIS
ncbi:hypothetical protein GCM10008905_28010 [Clostridium malenominatum]|uniref:Uncharacterized protein n=1 Tax=Clostridium malenominatum TaxID=1539 RepID=A0ABN1J4S0_9CLOT